MYYDRTTKVVTDHLRKLLEEYEDNPYEAWKQWINIWSQFPLDGFLQSTYDAVMTKVKRAAPFLETLDQDLEDLKKYLPWPDAAVTAYSIFCYTEQLDQSLVQYLRDQIGQWWSQDMHRIKGKMSFLPEAFTKPNIHGCNHDVHLAN